MSELYLLHPEPRPAMVVVQVPEVPTAVVSVVDYPLDEMSTLFDRGFSALFPALAAAGITPVGPAFSLHHRMPTATGDFEIGVPVDRVLPEPIDVDGVRIEPSVLPGGDVAGARSSTRPACDIDVSSPRPRGARLVPAHRRPDRRARPEDRP